MYSKKVRSILKDLVEGKISVDDAISSLKYLPYEDIGFAKIDHHRIIRKGFPEVVYCMGKDVKHVKEIFKRLIRRKNNILMTRASRELFKEMKKICDLARFNEYAKTITVEFEKTDKNPHPVLVVTGGTSDIPVAEEAVVTAEIMGNNVEKFYDAGVAGIHRLLSGFKLFDLAGVVIVVAGMDGALASVVGGIVEKPVIAVPTSVGYGASFGGISSLLTMLNACAPGIVVVNIDNGFGAGYFASIVNSIYNTNKLKYVK